MTDQQLAHTEAQLGFALHSSHRDLLKVTNGGLFIFPGDALGARDADEEAAGIYGLAQWYQDLRLSTELGYWLRAYTSIPDGFTLEHVHFAGDNNVELLAMPNGQIWEFRYEDVIPDFAYNGESLLTYRVALDLYAYMEALAVMAENGAFHAYQGWVGTKGWTTIADLYDDPGQVQLEFDRLGVQLLASRLPVKNPPPNWT